MAKPMKVVQIVTRMNTGGVAVLLDDLMTSFDTAVVDATLLLGSCDKTEQDYLAQKQVSYKHVRIQKLQKALNPLSDVAAFFSIYKLLKDIRPDIVHTHTSKAGIIGRFAATLIRPRPVRIHTYHGHLLVGYFSKNKTRVVYAVEKLFVPVAEIFIAMGSRVKIDLLEINLAQDQKFKVFFPGLPLKQLTPKSSARKKLGLDESQTYILFVGRIEEIKRVDRLIDAIDILRNKKIEFQCLVAGDGELFETMKRKAEGLALPMQFLGWRSDIWELLCASDISVLTSDNEAVPLTLIEASMAGLPLVSTNVGSVSDVLLDGVNGYIVESNAEALADALEKLTIDPVLREIMGSAGKERASRYFSLEKMSKDHTDLYQGLHR